MCPNQHAHTCKESQNERGGIRKKKKKKKLAYLALQEALGVQANWPNLTSGGMYHGWLPSALSLAAGCGPLRSRGAAAACGEQLAVDAAA